MPRSSTWIGAVVLLLVGCGNDGDDRAVPGGGSAPRVMDMLCLDHVVPVMSETRVYGQITLHDDDADVVEGAFRFSRPDGTVDNDTVVTLDDGPYARTERLDWNLEIIAAEPGIHRVELWVRDRLGNESNHEGCSIVAGERP